MSVGVDFGTSVNPLSRVKGLGAAVFGIGGIPPKTGTTITGLFPGQNPPGANHM